MTEAEAMEYHAKLRRETAKYICELELALIKMTRERDELRAKIKRYQQTVSFVCQDDNSGNAS